MNKIEKALMIGCTLIVIILCAVGILSSTKTYCGTVTDITESEDGFVLTVREKDSEKELVIQTSYIHTGLCFCHLERDIYWGDFMTLKDPMVEIRCKRFFNPAYYAETVVIQWNHDSETGIG